MTTINPEAVAERFASILHAWATDAEWATMRQANKAHTDDGVCASHDWCDANMAMYEAIEAVGGPIEATWGEAYGDNEAFCALWGRAWEIAKARYLTAE